MTKKELLKWQKRAKDSSSWGEFWRVCLDFKNRLNTSGIEMPDIKLILLVGGALPEDEVIQFLDMPENKGKNDGKRITQVERERQKRANL